ncbi:MAG: glycine--tRNA ligase subunit beta [bacterium]
MADLLLEVGTEEIPASYIQPALESLAQSARTSLANLRLSFESVHTWGTPRRLVLMVEGVSESQPDLDQEVMGPPEKVAFDPQGQPTKAALGFARAQGVTLEELRVVETPKGRYLAARKRQAGRATRDLLAEELPRWITQIPFPKSMRWGDHSLRFARPIHWILALLERELIPFQLDFLQSSHNTRGHRFMSPGQAMVDHPKHYLDLCRSLYVIVDPQERAQMIRTEADRAARSLGGRLLEDPELLNTVTYLVEYPVVVTGEFQKEFLELPREVLITSMREHQKFFSIQDENGNLLPYFVNIANLSPSSLEAIRKGNERVLRARLSDARFFFQEDARQPLQERVQKLSGIIFHAKLGTMMEKVLRIQSLAEKLATQLEPAWVAQVQRAAFLCKADLTTDMVGEFPSLQGIMGMHYALLQGEPAEVAEAIRDHYLPAFAGDRIPSGPVGAMVALADKLDTVVGCFAAGEPPSGAGDPLGVRRAALGVLRILLERRYRLNLGRVIEEALDSLRPQLGDIEEGILKDIWEFFKVRLENLWVSQGHDAAAVQSVLGSALQDLPQSLERLEAMERFMQEQSFSDLALSFKRVLNIVGDHSPAEVDPSLFRQPEENLLLELVSWAESQIPKFMENSQHLQALHELAAQRGKLDAFFDAVLVNDPDPLLKTNRLNMLSRLARVFLMLADFSKLSGRS